MPDRLKRSRILIIDDQPENVRLLDRLLRRAGYEAIEGTSDPRMAEKLFMDFNPDLILLDLHMPHLDGFQVMDRIRPHIPEQSYFPILFLTGDKDPEVRQRALQAGARDFLTKPFEITEVLLRIKNLLETRILHLRLQEHNETLEMKVQERTEELAQAQIEILHRLALAAEYRDDVTGQHAERVGVLASRVADELGLPSEDVQLMRRAATLHDVGKIGIPDAILLKPGPLTSHEFELMKSHTVIGARILSGSQFPLLRMARQISLTHHERWDGTGYTPGLGGEAIPIVGRIVAVADVFDCITHERPYKVSYTFDEAIEEIGSQSGAHFDPAVVDAFMKVVAQGDLKDLDLTTTVPSLDGELPLAAEFPRAID
jgi:putative two-component system response regulator